MNHHLKDIGWEREEKRIHQILQVSQKKQIFLKLECLIEKKHGMKKMKISKDLLIILINHRYSDFYNSLVI